MTLADREGGRRAKTRASIYLGVAQELQVRISQQPPLSARVDRSVAPHRTTIDIVNPDAPGAGLAASPAGSSARCVHNEAPEHDRHVSFRFAGCARGARRSSGGTASLSVSR